MIFIMSNHKYSVKEVLNFCKTSDIYIVNRKDRKNQLFKEKMGLMEEDLIREIRSLRKEHFYKGPFIDRDIPNNYLYEFHKMVHNKWCYIKMTIDDKKLVVVRVISFHESEGVAYA